MNDRSPKSLRRSFILTSPLLPVTIVLIIFHFKFEPPVETIRTGDWDADVQQNTARYTALLESVIRRYPGQWLWIHRRWWTRPPGEPDIY